MKVKGCPKEAPFMFIICLFGSFSFVLAQPAVAPGPEGDLNNRVDAKKVKDYVLHWAGNEEMTEFTYDQLQQWFLKRAANHSFLPFDYPRLFPLCVTRNQIIQGHPRIKDQSDVNMKKPLRVPERSHLFKFERIFHSIELRRKRFYQFNMSEDSMVHNKTFIKSITFHRINPAIMDMVNLRQWVHIRVVMAEKMMGLYLQAIVGPFGLPFGEFSVEFPCRDDRKNTADIDKVGQIAYCSYRPRTSIYHPSVYVGVDEKQRTVFHVHYKWYDLACMETPYIQFLMVAVKNFTTNPKYGIDFVPQLSPVMLNTGFDSEDGSPYPYHPIYRNAMWCYQTSRKQLGQTYENAGYNWNEKTGSDDRFNPLNWVVAENLTRVQANEEYDDCVLYDSGANINVSRTHTKQNETTYECGPGPLMCDIDYSKMANTKGINVTDFRQEMVSNETEVEYCYPCGVPGCLAVGFDAEFCNIELPNIEDLTKELGILNRLDDNFRIRNHGVGGMLSFLFLLPVGNIVGRFYKEMLGKCLFGNGPWISIHIVCSFLSLAAIWSSMGPMIPKLAEYRFQLKRCTKIHNRGPGFDDCFKPYRVDTPHNIIGMIAYLLAHLVPIFGFIRPSSAKTRYAMSLIHSFSGYLTYILGVVAVYLVIGDNCVDTLIFASIMITLPIIFSIVLVVLDKKSDKIIGVNPPRKQFPVLEQLELDSAGPLSFVKSIVLAVFIGLMSITWLLALLSLHIVAGSGDALIDGTQSFKGKKGRVFKGLQGIFGKCK